MLMRTPQQGPRRSRNFVVLLVLAALALISLDAGLGSSSPAAPARAGAGTVLGPMESAASGVLGPIRSIGDFFSSRDGLRQQNETLQAENARLRGQVETSGVDRERLAQLEGISELGTASGFRTVQAQVVALGGAQSFARTVTIDAGTAQGVHRDMTVLSADGLVGRVVSASHSTSTVLLLVDAGSTVGARLGKDAELGFVRGNGDLSGAGRLTLTTTDETVTPTAGDGVVSWGSRKQVPYVAGVPIGQVEGVTTNPRDGSRTITLAPYVDFSSLDVVGVVVATKGH